MVTFFIEQRERKAIAILSFVMSRRAVSQRALKGKVYPLKKIKKI